MLASVGVTSIDTRVASVTVNVVSPVTSPLVAETVALPTPVVVAMPFEPAALLTIAIALSDDAQVACAVRSCVELSVKTPVAVNCAVVPAAAFVRLGVISIDWRVGMLSGGGVVVSAPPPPPPQPASEPRNPNTRTDAATRTAFRPTLWNTCISFGSIDSGEVSALLANPRRDLHRRVVRVHVKRSAEVAIRRNRWLRSEEHTSELQSRLHLVCRLLLEK